MPKAHEMSEADAFRKSTAEFWSRMDQKGSSVATRRELTLAHSRKSTAGSGPRTPRSAATALKAKKRSKR
jgi:hypothetical protein